MLDIDLDFHGTSFGNEIGFRTTTSKYEATNAIYKPHPIANRTFFFQGETLAAESAAEHALVRFDESMRSFAHSRALRLSLMRIESSATVRTDGITPDHAQIVFLELAKRTGCESPKEQKRFLKKYFPFSSESTSEASFEAFRCLEAMKHIMKYQPRKQGLTLQELTSVYNLCLRGTKRERDAVFRSSTTEPTLSTDGHLGFAYQPAPPHMVIPLLEDLIQFCNRDYLSVMVRSSVEHFQLEAIKPVNEGCDRLGRMLALLVWKQCGLVENFLPPFSITPAVQTQKHTELLAPYQTGRVFEKRTAMVALDSWCAHCARAVSRSIKLSQVYREHIVALNADWRSRLREVRKGSLMDWLIDELMALPAVTITSITKQTGRGYASSSEAVEKLVEAGILQPQSDVKRNRLFIAPDAIRIGVEIEEAVLPDQACAREEFFE